MSMRLLSFSVLCTVAILLANPASGQSFAYVKSLPKDTVHIGKPRENDRRIHIRYRGINRIIPTMNVAQIAGNMGVVSIGLGWDHGCRGQWETAAMFGFIPKEDGEKSYVTFTLKESFIPWSVSLNDHVAFEPLTCGIYFNSILSRDFWVREPEKYPKGYYGFSTKIRLNIFIGEGITFYPKREGDHIFKSATIFYEFGTTDIYFISRATNKYLKFWDIFGLSFGVKVKLI